MLSVITERPQVVICLSSAMKFSLRFRLAVMTLTIVMLAAIIVGAAVVTWRQVSALRQHFSGVRIESFHIAEHLQAAVLALNATLLRFVLRREPGDWESFVLSRCPPLRDRPEDIPELVRYFLRLQSAEMGIDKPSIQDEAMQFLQQQPWRGNVRELESALRRALLVIAGVPNHAQQCPSRYARKPWTKRK